MSVHTYLSQLPFFNTLTTLEQQHLISQTKIHYYAKKTRLHFDSDECHGLIIVKRGFLRVFMTSESGREITLFQLTDTDNCILSVSCLFENINFVTTIEAMSSLELIIIPTYVIAKMSEQNIAIQQHFLNISQQRLSEIMWVLDQIIFQTFDRRLALFLQQQANYTNSLTLTLTHEQVAQHLGSAREVVSRMLKYFEKEGYVTLNRGLITLLNFPRELQQTSSTHTKKKH
ncbi:MAG: Crp/Fnr family transcriptional regulator [Culicoidibacterales bacterium]